MPKPPNEFAAELIGLVLLAPFKERNDRVAAAIRDRDFQLMTSPIDKIGGTSNE